MKNDLTCEVVNDLLPSFVDGLTNEETNQAVNIHLQSCEECAKACERMKTPEEGASSQNAQEIDFLKKTKKKSQVKLVAGILLTVLVLLILVFVNQYLIGHKVKSPEMVQVSTIVNKQKVNLYGNLTDTSKGISKVVCKQKNGVVTVTMYETKESFFHKNTFAQSFKCKSVITQVNVNGRIVWDNGDTIQEDVAALFETKHPYVGDMSANARSASALGIGSDFGDYTNELQTTEEPYGWKLISDKIYATNNRSKLEAQMKAYAAALIAVIDNLGYVSFQYNIGDEECNCTVTESDADAMAGQSVKMLGRTPFGLQELMKVVNLANGTTEYSMRDYIRVEKLAGAEEDGWQCNGKFYRYRLRLVGRLNGAVRDSCYTVLTNDAALTFEQVAKSLFSSNTKDFLNADDTVIIGMGY